MHSWADKPDLGFCYNIIVLYNMLYFIGVFAPEGAEK